MPESTVYNISEARPQLPALIRRTVEHAEEIHMGPGRRDIATLVATRVLTRYKELAQLALRFFEIAPPELIRQVVGEPAEPWAGLRTAIQAGRFGAAQSVEEEQEFTPRPPADIAQFLAHDEGAEPAGLSWHAMAARGNRNAAVSEFRRPITEEDE